MKAGIDLNRMEDPVIDHEAKKVILRLPEIQLKAGIVDEDEMRTMPANASVSLPEMRKASLADAEKEAKASGELTRTARENLESTIRGWLYPLLKQKGYDIARRTIAKYREIMKIPIASCLSAFEQGEHTAKEV